MSADRESGIPGLTPWLSTEAALVLTPGYPRGYPQATFREPFWLGLLLAYSSYTFEKNCFDHERLCILTRS